jgi:pSer/pThr/pTyr-binding forkhead associated (FHA) protein
MMVEYDFVVDLSNVCRSQILGAPSNGATLKTVRHLARALGDATGGRAPIVLYVADHSLWPLLDATDGAVNVSDWKRTNKRNLVQVPYADPAILGFAESTGCAVLSMDKYEDWRRTHSWIQGSTDRFVGWSKASNDDLHVYFRTMSTLLEEEASRLEEDRAFKDSGFDTRSREHEMVLGRMYRCDNPSCELHQVNPWFLIGPPRRDRRRDRLVCDSCGEEVIDVGEVGRVTQLKVDLLSSGSTGRFTIYQGEGTKIGRNTLLVSLSEPSSDDVKTLRRVSAEHVTLHADGPILMAADLGSTNGSTIQRYDRSSRSLYDPVRLEKHRPVQMNANDVLTLAEVVRIRRAGHRFRYDGLTTGEPEEGPGPGDTVATTRSK